MGDKLLNDQIVGQIKQAFSQLKEPVQVLFFSKQEDCDYCRDTMQLLQEVTDLSDRLDLSIYDMEMDADIARQFKVDKSPMLVITGRDGDQLQDYGVRMAGIPSGYEFSSLIQDLILVSSRDSGLSSHTREMLAKLDKPVHLQVFVTPT